LSVTAQKVLAIGLLIVVLFVVGPYSSHRLEKPEATSTKSTAPYNPRGYIPSPPKQSDFEIGKSRSSTIEKLIAKVMEIRRRRRNPNSAITDETLTFEPIERWKLSKVKDNTYEYISSVRGKSVYNVPIGYNFDIVIRINTNNQVDGRTDYIEAFKIDDSVGDKRIKATIVASIISVDGFLDPNYDYTYAK